MGCLLSPEICLTPRAADGQGALPLPKGIQPRQADFALWRFPAKSPARR